MKPDTSQPKLAKGQVWKVQEHYLRILEIGKTLVHYRVLREPESKGVQAQVSSIAEIEDHLRANQAKLVNPRAR